MRDASKKFSGELLSDLYIDGAWRTGTGHDLIDVIDPYDNQEICRIAPASIDQVDDAVEAAHRAFHGPAWKAMTGRARGELLFRLAQLLRRDLELFASIESIDTGIPIRETRMEVATSALHLEYFAGLAGKIEGSCQDLGARFNYLRREPYGVIGQIVPWNTPLKLMARGFAAAVACGNTIVIKPSAIAPLSNLRFARLVHEAGFPSGTINIVTGLGRTIGRAIVEHPKVRKVIFTGGLESGREILHQCSKRVTPAVLELGEKGPIIVCEETDWEETVDGVLTQAFARKAEVCFAGTRLFVPQRMHDRFVATLVQKVSAIPMGDPLDPATQLGPLATPARVEEILTEIEAAQRAGANVRCGGRKSSAEALAQGNFLLPTILTDVAPSMRIMQEEIFGPVLCVMPYQNLDDALAMANDNQFGLAGYVWCNDIRKAHATAAALQCGNVFINSYGYQSEIPFGGFKASGMGREHGLEAMREYTQVKSVTVGLERFQSRFDLSAT